MTDVVAAPENTGTLRRTASGWFAQFSLGGGQRKGALLATCKTEREARARKLMIASLVARLRETGHTGDILVNTIREGGTASDAEMRKLVRLVERIATGKEPGLARQHGGRREGTTVADLADLWTSGKLAAQFPDHVKLKKRADEDARILACLGKVRMSDGTTFGERPVAQVTLDDCDRAMSALPRSARSSQTRRNYAQTLRRLLVYAVYPLRLLPALPIPKGWLPKPGARKALAWIYPTEDLALMKYGEEPVVRRLLFGVLGREGLRLGEALRLTWADVDLDRGVMRLDANKTDDPRSWAMGDDVTRALAAWKNLRGKKAEKIPRVFPKALVGPRHELPRKLRRALERVGVTRPELLVPKPGRLPLRVHDLRGTFVTLALASGRTEAWVTDRTGHKSSQMIYKYKRASRTASELGLGWFAPLDEGIPELAGHGPKSRGGANGVQTGGPRRPQTPRGGSRSAEEIASQVSAGSDVVDFKTGVRRRMSSRAGSIPVRLRFCVWAWQCNMGVAPPRLAR